jgi:transcription initiation factor IIF auxiliary subunit
MSVKTIRRIILLGIFFSGLSSATDSPKVDNTSLNKEQINEVKPAVEKYKLAVKYHAKNGDSLEGKKSLKNNNMKIQNTRKNINNLKTKIENLKLKMASARANLPEVKEGQE